MTRVYLLWHVARRGSDDEDAKLLGVFSSQAKAELVIVQVRSKPGFHDQPGGFEIRDYVVDRPAWVDGFMTVPSEHQ